MLDRHASGYVWLPMRFDGERLHIEWLDEWYIEDFDREIRVRSVV